MSKGFSSDKDDLRILVRKSEIRNIMKKYKQLQKYQKSPMFEAAKLYNKETIIDKLINKYGIDSESLE
jgi:hypothetical protein